MAEHHGLTTPVGFGEALLLCCVLGGVALDAYAIDQIDGAYHQSALNDRSLMLHFSAFISVVGTLLMVPAVVFLGSAHSGSGVCAACLLCQLFCL